LYPKELTVQTNQITNGLQPKLLRKKDLEYIDHLCNKYGIPNDRKLRQKIHQAISGQHYADTEIEEIVEDVANQSKNNIEQKESDDPQ